ncbi:MAG: glycosyltransferase family 39 protein [Methylobacillus sp.]|jgi:4-amino-4-deoxy-L-arabinose transferase-like glycosyltransferase|nr:glycosyltransferase family 39 protein [Methylobacillus sp.]
MKHTLSAHRRNFFGTPFLFVSLAVWLGFLGWLRPLTLPDEGRYSGVAWEMARSGEFFTPLLNGLPYFHKPPLFYWLDMLSMKLFGMNEWAARAPSLLAAWLALIGLYFFTRAWRDERAARVAVVMLAASPLFFGGAQFANMDMLVAAMISLCVLAGADTALRRAEGRPWRMMSLATAALAALGVLSKGLIGLALPGMALALWFALRRDRRGFLALLWPPAIVVFALVALPWFVLMQMRYPDFFNYFFIYQQVERYSGTGFNNAQPFWFYVPLLLGGMLPWTLWIWPLTRKTFWAEDPRGLRLLMGLWLAVVLVFFSLPASKLVGYIFPALMPLVFLLSEALLSRMKTGENFFRAAKPAITLVAAVAVCLVVTLAIDLAPHRSDKALSLRLRAQINPGDTLVLLNGYPFDLPFYARYRRAAWVVNDWDNRVADTQRDNWRKEIYDAGKFDPAAAHELLITPDVWKQRLCAAPDGGRFWVWGQASALRHYPWLRDLPPAWSRGETRVWRIETTETFKQSVCARF